MNIAVSFSLRFAYSMLDVIRKFSQRSVLCLQSYHILYNVASIFQLINDVFTLIKMGSICLVLKTRSVILLKIISILVKLKVNI